MRQFELFASATLPTSWEMAAILLGVPLIFLILSLALNTACVVGNAVFRLGGTSVDVRRINIIKGCGIVFCGAFFGAVVMAVLSWPLSVLHPRIEQLISKGVLIGMIAYFL
ncbi:MAG: hypothetical protein QGF59_08505, partial [Pirellulaceae bacterium]|nr:hypothetical protein [Pirellulaceae bacterium]